MYKDLGERMGTIDLFLIDCHMHSPHSAIAKPAKKPVLDSKQVLLDQLHFFGCLVLLVF